MRKKIKALIQQLLAPAVEFNRSWQEEWCKAHASATPQQRETFFKRSNVRQS